ncbi:hypothetical protein KFK09_023188 [Dendrobium nobile]|uniref:Trichome birefringence-like C-terminal domain-containing protein n=1 Tax=Dendrobium nobile TaxID=94219 RepID=A0A8T3ALE9_DENNO|nr:hypothetical protein KFK09_023188 [Dendrobium nobile]
MEEGRLFKELNPMVAYEKGLTTWAKWVDMNLDPRRTRVMFRSASARHNRVTLGPSVINASFETIYPLLNKALIVD